MLITSHKQILGRLMRPTMLRSFSHSAHHDDHYQVLGVKTSASMDEVKHAYRELCKKYHPDVCKDHDSEDRFKKISHAYQTLKTAYKQGIFGSNKMSSGPKKDYEQRTSTTYKYSASTNANRSANAYSRSEGEQANDEAWREYQKSTGKEEEEILYEQIFKRNFREDPAYYYKKENEHLRRRYEEEIAKRREARGEPKDEARRHPFPDKDPEEEAFWREFARDHGQYSSDTTGTAAATMHSQNQGGSGGSGNAKYLGAGLAVFAGVIGYMLYQERKKTTSRFEKLGSQDLDTVRSNFIKREEEKKEKRKLEFQDSLALMKKYPRRNPNAISMLVDYSIWNDIKIYSVPWTYFHGYEDELTTKTNNFEKNRIHNVKQNTMVTLSLEAERALKNVYVKVDDVVKSLSDTGHFEPPGVFFRYYGYIYVKIRRKPIIAENLKECIDNKDKLISVFDLYFRYSTPILMANNEYYEIPLKHHAFIPDTTTREGIGWVGNAHINHRSLDKKIYNPEEKNVFLWKGPMDTSAAHQRYLRTWGVHYPVYEKHHN